MIPQMNIVAWGNVVPWVDQRQVEQDLIISRAIIELFTDKFLNAELRFRGGTALNKLHFPAPIRYSEDIDLVRTTAGPIRPILDRVRAVLEPWLGGGSFKQSATAPKLRFRVSAEGPDPDAHLRLKVEINIEEIEALGGSVFVPFSVTNPWFTGEAEIHTFSREEMLATKLRAFLQRDKGRDLLDLAHALDVFEGLNLARVVEYLLAYLARSKLRISRAEAEMRMLAKLRNPYFAADIRPLLAADRAKALSDDAIKVAFGKVLHRLVALLPGEPWAETRARLSHHGIAPQP